MVKCQLYATFIDTFYNVLYKTQEIEIKAIVVGRFTLKKYNFPKEIKINNCT